MYLRLGDGGVRAGERVLPEDRERGAVVQPQSEPSAGVSLDDRIREVESNLIGWALKASDGNKSKAAELLQGQTLDTRRSHQEARFGRSGDARHRTAAGRS